MVVRGTPPPRSPGDKPVEVTGASRGVYLDFEPYSLLRFTWNADWAPGEESVVTVRLSDAEDGGTLMDFTHDKFLTPQSAAGHNLGWNSAFNRLVTFLEVIGRWNRQLSGKAARFFKGRLPGMSAAKYF